MPWRGRARLRKLLATPRVSTAERLSLYASTIAFQWAMVAAVAWRAWAHGFTAAELGLVIAGKWRGLLAGIVGGAALAGFQWLNLRRMGRLPVASRGLLQSLAERIFPQSGVEMLPFFALALTAGTCEEFLYRGFAIGAFLRAGLPNWEAVLISTFLFGLAHLYQGYGGAVGTMLLGGLFGAARIGYHSLIPVFFWHSAVDLTAGVAGPRYLCQTLKADTKPQNGA
ncbi:MAG: CPBP family intramembrane glutamic endopeptidase [Candidatus Acidiferrales bacterium]